jgi:hypothetical protein
MFISERKHTWKLSLCIWRFHKNSVFQFSSNPWFLPAMYYLYMSWLYVPCPWQWILWACGCKSGTSPLSSACSCRLPCHTATASLEMRDFRWLQRWACRDLCRVQLLSRRGVAAVGVEGACWTLQIYMFLVNLWMVRTHCKQSIVETPINYTYAQKYNQRCKKLPRTNFKVPLLSINDPRC